MKKWVVGLVVVLLFALGTVPAAAQTQEEIDASVATYDDLSALVAAEVEKTYNEIEKLIGQYVSDIVVGIIGNGEVIRDTAAPLIKDLVAAELAKYQIVDGRVINLVNGTIDAALYNKIVDAVINDEFVQAIIARSVRYTVEDIVAALDISADEAALVATITENIWNAPLREAGTSGMQVKSHLDPAFVLGGNLSYYAATVHEWNRGGSWIKYNTTPKSLTITGWNASNIKLYITANAGLNAVASYEQYAEKIANMDYTSIVLAATGRAVKDEICERTQAILYQAKTCVVTALQGELAKIDVWVSLSPDQSYDKIFHNILVGFVDKAARDTVKTVLKFFRLFR